MNYIRKNWYIFYLKIYLRFEDLSRFVGIFYFNENLEQMNQDIFECYINSYSNNEIKNEIKKKGKKYNNFISEMYETININYCENNFR